ncbi:MAG: hypothetical protein V4617_12560 [Gemmatimonadota bacterium]
MTLRHALLAMLVVPAALTSAEPRSTSDVVRAMHGAYAGKWWRTLTFRQKSMFFEANGTMRVEYWTEAEEAPGKLRVVTEPASDGNVRLYTRDSTYTYARGALVSATPGRHPLVMMLSDVYAVAPSVTMSRMRELLIDTTQFRREQWQGRPVFVMGKLLIGARSREAWIDAERLVLVRLIQSSTTARFKVLEYRIGGHRRAAGGWLEQWLETWEDGRLAFREEYERELINPTLDPRLFDPSVLPAAAPTIPLKAAVKR